MFNQEGVDTGPWDPTKYTDNILANPIDLEMEAYKKALAEFKNPFWTSRSNTAITITSDDKVSKTKYDVYGWWWGSNPKVNPRGEIDNLYIKLFGRRGEPTGIEYWENDRVYGSSLARIEQGMKLQPEWKQVCEGECKPNMPECTYLFGSYWEYNKEKFMNKYGISPQQISNVPATDQSGKTFALEWEEEFPWDGEYIFNVQADNQAHLYIDNDLVGEKILLGSGGAAGNTLSPPQKIKKFVSAGTRKITLDLLNLPKMEMKKIQSEIVPTSDEVTFTVSTASLFATGFEIPDLGIDISKEYGDGKDIKETITKKLEYGRVYPVKLRSSNQRISTSTTSKGIEFSGFDGIDKELGI